MIFKKRDLKSSFKILSASSLIMISMLSPWMHYMLFKIIIFRRNKISVFSMIFNFIFNVIVTPKISYSYWVMIIFFFRIKKCLINVSLSAFISFFSLKIFLKPLITASLLAYFCSLFNLKRFFTSLIMFSSIFSWSSGLGISIIKC